MKKIIYRSISWYLIFVMLIFSGYQTVYAATGQAAGSGNGAVAEQESRERMSDERAEEGGSLPLDALGTDGAEEGGSLPLDALGTEGTEQPPADAGMDDGEQPSADVETDEEDQLSEVPEAEEAGTSEPGDQTAPGEDSEEQEEAEPGTWAAADEPLSMNVTYSELKCGTPVTFTVSASGSFGTYIYYWNRLLRKVNGVYENEIDLSFNNGYQESNTFSYTFAVSGDYKARFYVMSKGPDPENPDQLKIDTEWKEIYFTINDPSAPTLNQVVDGIVAECESRQYETEYEKALFFHDWICDHAVYDNSLRYMDESGVLVRGTGTCESYHKALTMLLGRIGVPTYRVEGDGHVWTLTCLDGIWTQIDATWDGGSHPAGYEYLQHMYFGVTEEMMGNVHTKMQIKHNSLYPADAGILESIRAVSYERNYFIRSGEIRRWSDPIKTQILERIAQGETEFAVDTEYNMYPTVYKLIYPLVAYVVEQEHLKQWNFSVPDAEVNRQVNPSKIKGFEW